MDPTHKDRIPPELLLDCFWRLNLDLQLEYASPAAAAMFGIPAEALAGSPLTDHVDRDDVDDLRDRLTRRLSGSDRTRSFLTVVRVHHADGHLVPVEVHGRLALGPDGEPEAVIGLARDISRRQEELDRARDTERRRLQEQKLDSVVRLAGAVATPLDALLDAVDRAGATADAPALAAASERARHTLEQLRRLAGEQELARRDVMLDGFVTDAVATIGASLPTDVALVHQAGAEGAICRLDVDVMTDVLGRLCDNARRAMSGRGVIRVGTSLASVEPDDQAPPDASPQAWARIAVIDTGAGLDGEASERILEPYYSAGVGERPGLGLPLAHGSVRQHGGHLEVTSRIGHGTTVEVVLPASVAETGADGTPGAPRPRVLLVDDDHNVLRYCARVLHAAGFDVIACEDGAEALGYVAGEESLDLVVLDWALPGLDGRRVREQLMARHPRLPVLIISGYERGDFEPLGGVDATTPWLHKPFTPAALLAEVRRLLPLEDEARES